MKELTDEELKQVNGGLSIIGCLGIVAGVIFIVGILDGYTRPLKCNE